MKTMPPVILAGAVWVTFMSVLGTFCMVMVVAGAVWKGISKVAGWIDELTGERIYP